MDAFLRAVAANDPSHIQTTAADCFASHQMVFAAEQARREHRVVEIAELRSRNRNGLGAMDW